MVKSGQPLNDPPEDHANARDDARKKKNDGFGKIGWFNADTQ